MGVFGQGEGEGRAEGWVDHAQEWGTSLADLDHILIKILINLALHWVAQIYTSYFTGTYLHGPIEVAATLDGERGNNSSSFELCHCHLLPCTE